MFKDGYIEAKWFVETTDGGLVEYGYGSTGIVAVDYKAMLESTRLDASTKVLHRQGYFIDNENYEELNMEHVKDTKLLDYHFFYLSNDYRNFEDVSVHKKRYIVVRGNDGRYKEFIPKTKVTSKTSLRNRALRK